MSYALFCAADGQLPLFYDVHDGNRDDSRQFALILERFHQFLRELAGGATVVATSSSSGVMTIRSMERPSRLQPIPEI